MTQYDPRKVGSAAGALIPPPPPPPQAAPGATAPAPPPAPAPNAATTLPAHYPGAANQGKASGLGPGPGPMAGVTKATTGAIPNQVPAPATGGGGGGGGPAWAAGVKDPVDDFATQIMNTLRGQIGPDGGPWDAKTIDAAKQSTKESQAAADKQSRNQILRDAVASGLGRSSSTQALLAQSKGQNSASASAGYRDIEKNATLQNYQARSQAIEASMKYIDQARNWVLASDKSMMEKQELLARMAQAGASAAAAQQDMQLRIVGMMMQESNNVPEY
jgi:hypothetical protein